VATVTGVAISSIEASEHENVDMTIAPRADKDEISRVFTRIRTAALAVVFAMIGGLGLFLMTAWLLIRGGPHVGQHLQLLSNYFIGYSVTWGGSIVGFFYGAVAGGVIGWSVSTLYNKIIWLRQR
jgi:hypothetical protein